MSETQQGSIPPPTEESQTETQAEEPKPTGAKPAGSKPAGSKPAGSKPAGSKPAGSKPAGSKPAGAKPAGARPAGARPAGARPAGARPAGAKPAGAKPGAASGSTEGDAKSKPTGEVQFIIESFAPVYLHSWEGEQDTCSICREQFTMPCNNCQANGFIETCPKVTGVCNHTFHLHCIEKWVIDHPKCPLCQSDWEPQ